MEKVLRTQAKASKSGEASAHDFIRAQNRNVLLASVRISSNHPPVLFAFARSTAPTFRCLSLFLSLSPATPYACLPKTAAIQPICAIAIPFKHLAQPVGDGNARHLLTNRRPVASVPRVGVFAAFDFTPCGPCLADRGQAEKRSREWGTRPDREANLRSRE